MPTYILQRDTPLDNKGEEFTKSLSKPGCYVSASGRSIYDAHVVEDNTEWFKLKEENKKMHVEIFEEYPHYLRKSYRGEYYTYSMQIFSGEIKPEKMMEIKKAIEKVLNNKSEEGYKHHLSLDQLETIYTSVIHHFIYVKKSLDPYVSVPNNICAKEWAEHNKEKFISLLIEEYKNPKTGTSTSPNNNITATI